MNLDEMDTAAAIAEAVEKAKPKVPAVAAPGGWRASLWTPMSHRELCETCRTGGQHAVEDCLSPATCECSCWMWRNAMNGFGGMD